MKRKNKCSGKMVIKRRPSFKWLSLLSITILLILIFLGFQFWVKNTLRFILLLPDNKIDIGRAALIVAKDFYPDLNINLYSAKIDNMVKEFKERFQIWAEFTGGDMEDPDSRIRYMNNYFYLHKEIRYDLIDFELRNPQNFFLNGILDTNKSACVTMPTLYLAITQRLGWPIYGINVPEHLLLRYDDGEYKSNIETTGGGGWSPDEDYIEQLQISEQEIKNGVFLKTMSHKETLGIIIETRADLYLKMGEYEKAARDFELSLKLNPTNVGAIRNLSQIYGSKLDRYEEGKRFHEKLIELGYNFDRIPTEADPGYAEHVLSQIKSQGLDSLYGDRLKYLEEAIEIRKKLKTDILRQREEEILDYEQPLPNYLLPEHIIRGPRLHEVPPSVKPKDPLKELEEFKKLQDELTKYSKQPWEKQKSGAPK